MEGNTREYKIVKTNLVGEFRQKRKPGEELRKEITARLELKEVFDFLMQLVALY